MDAAHAEWAETVRVTELRAAFSLAPDKDTLLQTEVDACAWTITDVREVSPQLPITVVTIGTSARADRAERMCQGAGARLIREPCIDEWALGVASELRATSSPT